MGIKLEVAAYRGKMVKINLLNSRPHVVKCYSSQPFVIPIKSKLVVACVCVCVQVCFHCTPLECAPHYLLYEVLNLYIFLPTINLCTFSVFLHVSIYNIPLYEWVFLHVWLRTCVWTRHPTGKFFYMKSVLYTAKLWCFHQVKNYREQKGSLLATLR